MEDFPKKDRSRAKRRFLKQRMKRKARWISKYIWGKKDTNKDAKIADHLAFCDCLCCQNPRKTYKEKTLQERKAEDDAKDQERMLERVLTSY